MSYDVFLHLDSVMLDCCCSVFDRRPNWGIWDKSLKGYLIVRGNNLMISYDYMIIWLFC